MLIVVFILYIYMFVNFFNFYVLELSYREVENVFCVEKLQVSCKLICVYKNKYVYVSLFYGKIIKYYFLLDVNIKQKIYLDILKFLLFFVLCGNIF